MPQWSVRTHGLAKIEKLRHKCGILYYFQRTANTQRPGNISGSSFIVRVLYDVVCLNTLN